MIRKPIIWSAASALVISTFAVFAGCADDSGTAKSPTPVLEGTVVADGGEIGDRAFELLAVLKAAGLTVADVGEAYVIIEEKSTLAGDAIAAAVDETTRQKLVDQGFLAEQVVKFRDPAGGEVQVALQAYLTPGGAAAAMADARAETATAAERFSGGELITVEAKQVEVPPVGDESHGVDTYLRQKTSADSEVVFEVFYSALVARHASFKVSIATTPRMDYAAIAAWAGTLFSRLPADLPQ